VIRAWIDRNQTPMNVEQARTIADIIVLLIEEDFVTMKTIERAVDNETQKFISKQLKVHYL
jgi:hypothetical protein